MASQMRDRDAFLDMEAGGRMALKAKASAGLPMFQSTHDICAAAQVHCIVPLWYCPACLAEKAPVHPFICHV